MITNINGWSKKSYRNPPYFPGDTVVSVCTDMNTAPVAHFSDIASDSSGSVPKPTIWGEEHLLGWWWQCCQSIHLQFSTQMQQTKFQLKQTQFNQTKSDSSGTAIWPKLHPHIWSCPNPKKSKCAMVFDVFFVCLVECKESVRKALCLQDSWFMWHEQKHELSASAPPVGQAGPSRNFLLTTYRVSTTYSLVCMIHCKARNEGGVKEKEEETKKTKTPYNYKGFQHHQRLGPRKWSVKSRCVCVYWNTWCYVHQVESYSP